MARIVVIGASQGGVDALIKLVKALPEDFPAPLLITLHIGGARSLLPSLLGEAGHLKVSHAVHGEPIERGHIYVAPPDRHMIVTYEGIALTRGPRENWARPAIDPLFRSAAEIYGPDVIGVILSGRLNDGTAGLYEIKRRGGMAIVQDPGEAEAPDMPQSALDNVPVDYCMPLADIPGILLRHAREEAEQSSLQRGGAETMSDQGMTRPVAMTCPECGGAMREEMLGTLTRYRCHIGHIMTAEVMAASQVEEMEKSLSFVTRSLHERSAFCLEMARKRADAGDEEGAKAWRQAADEASARQAKIQEVADAQWSHPEMAARKSPSLRAAPDKRARSQ